MVIGVRNLTAGGRKILSRIFDELAARKEELAEQARMAKVASLDKEGSIRFVAPPSIPASRKFIDRVPNTAIFDDADGIPIHILLHIVERKPHECEVYKANGSIIINKPTAGQLYF